jgi:hydrogenase 3 maturation protease
LGSELRGDDAAGVAVARVLAMRPGRGWPLLVIDAGFAPENQIGPLRRFKPDLVLLVDAAHMDEAPGTVRLLAWQEAGGLSASTHTLPPSVLAEYLTTTLGCEVALLGIQPANDAIGARLSPEVRQAIAAVAQALDEVKPLCGGCS